MWIEKRLTKTFRMIISHLNLSTTKGWENGSIAGNKDIEHVKTKEMSNIQAIKGY